MPTLRSSASSRLRSVPGGYLVGLLGLLVASTHAAEHWTVYYADNASWQEAVAAREVRRYAFLRTGELPEVQRLDAKAKGIGEGFLVARKDQPILATLVADPRLRVSLGSLGPQQTLLKTIDTKGGRLCLVVGGDDPATLYAAYRLAEHLGVRFYLHGDVVPDQRLARRLPALDERQMPLFSLRGIQPFHDFPEGPDWWNRDDYLAILAQLPKLGMNFFGLHTYPEKRPNAEPTVWIGTEDDLDAGGRVRFSYPSSYQNTLRGNWGYAAKQTGSFSYGAGDLFERDAFGAEVMGAHLPEPASAEAANEIFERTAAVWRDAFTYASWLGIQTCIGTETPLVIPQAVQDRLKAKGKDLTQKDAVQQLYQGMFRRIMQAHPLDYYWFWTPENWTWEGTSAEQVSSTTNDLYLAIEAARAVKAPFKFATCGWVLGPQDDRAMFARILPPEIAVSCINREVGKTPVDRAFAEITGRGKWAIPWLEDDPALTSPQLWAGRMRRDAADARRYGCDGLLGIHWRTRVLGPAVLALARAAWDQNEWNKAPFRDLPPIVTEGPSGGKSARFAGHEIADTDDDALYQSVRYGMRSYRLPVPVGSCKVTLRFCEPHYDAPGKRVFDVKLQGQTVIKGLDIFARVGKDRALDFVFTNIPSRSGWIYLEFNPRTEFPSLAALDIQGDGFVRKVNCGGDAYKDYAADWREQDERNDVFPPVDDFYLDWARAEFGPEIAVDAGRLFSRIDGRLPRPSDWVEGPGGIRPDTNRWEAVHSSYLFVDEFAALGPRVQGAGSRARFDYWANTFRYLRAMAELNCAWGEQGRILDEIKAEKDHERQLTWARERFLPQRRLVVEKLSVVYRYLLATVSNPGEMGTVANWDQHLLPDLLDKPAKQLKDLTAFDLPAEAWPTKHYDGPPRLIVPTTRTSVLAGEPLALKAIVLAAQPVRDVQLLWRRTGMGKFTPTTFAHEARGVYRVALAADQIGAEGVEYFVKATLSDHTTEVYPPTAPALNQTVIQLPAR